MCEIYYNCYHEFLLQWHGASLCHKAVKKSILRTPGSTEWYLCHNELAGHNYWMKWWITTFRKCTAYLVHMCQFIVGVLHAVAVHVGVCSVTVVVSETCVLLLQEAVTNLHRLIGVSVISNIAVSSCRHINSQWVWFLCCLDGWYTLIVFLYVNWPVQIM